MDKIVSSAVASAIINGLPGVTIQITAAELHDIILAMLQLVKDKPADTNDIELKIPERPMTRMEVAKSLGISISSVIAYERKGLLTPIRCGKTYRYRFSEVRNIVNEWEANGKPKNEFD